MLIRQKIMLKRYENFKILEEKNSEIEFEATIPTEVLNGFENEVLADIQKDFEIQGFRKGQVPIDIVKSRVNAMHVVEDAADMALRDIYPEILDGENLNTISAPSVTIMKMAPGNPLVFKVRAAVAPKFKLPDYAGISKKVMSTQPSTEVGEDDINDAIKNIQKMRMPAEAIKGKKEEEITYPDLTDEYVKTLGQFDSVADFKSKLKESLAEEKKSVLKRAAREELAAKLVEATKIELPAILVKEEINVARNHRYEDLERMGVKMEDYLKKIGKTEEELDKLELSYVERQLTMRFIIEEIARKENITPSEEFVSENSAYIRDKNPEADPENVRHYLESVSVNEQVLEFLESGKKPPVKAEKESEKK